MSVSTQWWDVDETVIIQEWEGVMSFWCINERYIWIKEWCNEEVSDKMAIKMVITNKW